MENGRLPFSSRLRQEFLLRLKTFSFTYSMLLVVSLAVILVRDLSPVLFLGVLCTVVFLAARDYSLKDPTIGTIGLIPLVITLVNTWGDFASNPLISYGTMFLLSILVELTLCVLQISIKFRKNKHFLFV